jgi:hypothetical protein
MADETARPIWLLDVDGVLNAFDESGPVVGDWGDWETFTAKGFPIRFSPRMTSRIREMHEAGTVEVRWLTTWGRWANTDLPQFGFPEFQVAAEQPFRDRGGWWKLPVAQELFNQGHAVIWTDDDITFSSDAMDWLKQVANSDRACDLFAFAPQGAISQREMDDICIWTVNRGLGVAS